MTRYIELTRGAVAIVDDADYVWLSQWNWFLHSGGYAVRTIRGGIVYMHRQIMNARAGVEVDHRNRNKLDNQRNNLRVASTAENQHNRAPRAGRNVPYKGVRFDADRGKYRARITVNKREIHLGRYDTPEEAARVYDDAARQHFGEFARTNF